MRRVLGVLVGAAMLCVSTVAQAQISIRIGDNDGYGFGVADNGPAPWPCYVCYDGRSAAEAAATDGSQITDVYAALFPNAGPNNFLTARLTFTLSQSISNGFFTVDMGDFQIPGYLQVSYNGVLQPGLLDFVDGFQNTAVRTFALSAAAVANANAAGAFVVDIDASNQTDYVAFDYFQFDARTVNVVPEPATVILTAAGLALVAFARRRRA